STENGIPNNQITAIALDNVGNLWIGSYNGGLSRLLPSGKIENLYTAPEFQKISAMTFDSVQNTLYVGTLGNGTHVLRLKNGTPDSLYNIATPQWVHHLFLTSTGAIIANSKVIKPSSQANYNKINEIETEPCNSATEDHKRNLYLGGEDWIAKCRPNDDSITYLKQGVYNGTTQSMVIDRYGNLWYTTQDLLVHYSLKENRFESFTAMDGLPSNEFCMNAVYQDSHGIIYLGTNNGMTIFDPQEDLQKLGVDAEISFTTLSVVGENITFGNSTGILDAPVNLAKRITLKHSQNKFTLQFGINEYINQHRIRFRFRLKGFDDNWYRVRQLNRSVSFTNIPEGNYTLEIKAFIENNDEQFITKSIDIIIYPPWYNTWWAYIIYAVVIGLILLAIKAIIHNRLILKNQQEENQKKELRLQMFTNLSHEIRTPLSLVETPLNSLIDSEQDTKKAAILQLMRRNVQRVTSQLNRFMDIRKIDNHKFNLKLQNADIVDFISDIVKSFDQLSLIRNININLNSNNFDTKFAFDPYNLDKAVFNIMSNAFKFTPDGGFININIEKSNDQVVVIKIENSGSHIPNEECERIFERYYQTTNNRLNEGSGIGLHLAKMIIDAHNGFIKAYNTEQGVEFAITLPFYTIEQETENQEIKTPQHTLFVSPSPDSPAEIQSNKKLKKVLFIDDDTEWTGYISMALSDKFNIVVCNHSEDAMTQIIDVKPDAIITDLVMPGINGIELCKKIRQNPQTNLLPIIVLTSQTDDESRQTCVETGVDHYLTKPVSINMLKISITNAISTREKMAARMAADIHSSQNVIEAESPDQKLLKKVVDTINKNLESATFGVNELSAKVGISRVHLNRKLKELLDITPVNLIKSIKMRQAAVLLVRNKLNVADVAFKLGFSSHSYFSSHFKEYYGISPTEFITKYSAPENQEEFEKMVRM
ncbi:MAG: response regulator, partial [Bacteroidales bacterium]|nr:response regulator [Bacteroidales bacterium]